MLGTINLKKYSREYLRKVYEERICKNCLGLFYVIHKGKRLNKSPGYIRTRNATTCTKKCSKIYKRNYYVPLINRNPLDNKI